MRLFYLPLLIAALFLSFQLQASSLESYGQLPAIRAPSLSPDGRHLAYIIRAENHDRFVVYNLEQDKLVYMGEVSAFKARNTGFLTNKHAVLWGSDTTFTLGFRFQGKREHTGALVHNIANGKTRALLKDMKGLHRAQSGLGYIVGVDAEDEVAYMPAWDDSYSPTYNLYKIRLSSGKGRLIAEGNSHTLDWFVDAAGNILAREDFDDDEDVYSIHSLVSGQWKEIYREEGELRKVSALAASADGSSLFLARDEDEGGALHQLNLASGELQGPLYAVEEADLDGVLTDNNKQLQGVVYSGLKPSYQFRDEKFTNLFARLEVSFPGSSVHFESWSDDRKRVIFRVSGNEGAGTYYLLDAEAGKILSTFGSQYEITDIAQIKAFRYKARDGLSIPALVTFPVGIEERKNLPLVVIPHGGPESYDQIGFDWLPQFLAARGYLVLQPNFRGSAGFGKAFRDAGRGKWGREMQDDVSDGVLALVRAGMADKERVCIMGGSYGGYSALAGGAFSPDLYRCVVSFNGVSDVDAMIADRKNRLGQDHWAVSYWHKLIGDSKSERQKLRDISPVNFADNFRAPVLLLHGKDDLVVPLKQSELMRDALKKADKPVELTVLKGEDHWLSSSETRLELLTLVDEFLKAHNPP